MTPLLPPDCDLLTIPFSASTDFLDLADCCDRFAATLNECVSQQNIDWIMEGLCQRIGLAQPQSDNRRVTQRKFC